MVGQAQTGTGKTAAFALPLLSKLDLKRADPQILVLTPTRELAIQVAEAFQSYASHLRGFQVLPVYGGQDYAVQLRQLKRGVHVVVGTPGRLMDHMRRGTLKLTGLSTVVLDEADEMLRMGFIETSSGFSVRRRRRGRWHCSPRRCRPLSGASRNSIARPCGSHHQVAHHHRRDDPSALLDRHRRAQARRAHAPARNRTVRWVLVFVRTRIAAVELAERLQARGYATSALNGDMAQKQRELTISRLKSGALDILVATDVAARGLDVERISHVINFDIPNDTEAYVHRIGRTGRAGRSGEAILFVAPRERQLLRAIEKATRQQIEPMELPSDETVNDKRIAKFTQRITDTLATRDLDFFRDIVVRYQQQHDADPVDIARSPAKAEAAARERRRTLDKRPRAERPERARRQAQSHEHRRSMCLRRRRGTVSRRGGPVTACSRATSLVRRQRGGPRVRPAASRSTTRTAPSNCRRDAECSGCCEETGFGRQLDIRMGTAPPPRPIKKRGVAPRKSNADNKPHKPVKERS